MLARFIATLASPLLRHKNVVHFYVTTKSAATRDHRQISHHTFAFSARQYHDKNNKK
jgi:hypothetical protein